MADMKAASVGHTGCTEEEMTISDQTYDAPSQRWTVHCHDRVFLCDKFGQDISCHERQQQ
jgi:hypothetical protein